VPNIRLAYRWSTLQAEREMALGAGFDPTQDMPAVMLDPAALGQRSAAPTAGASPALAATKASPVPTVTKAPEPAGTVVRVEEAPLGPEPVPAPAATPTPTPPLVAPPSPGGRAMQRVSVLSAIGVLGAAHRRRSTTNEGLTDAQPSTSVSPAAAPAQAPVQPLAAEPAAAPPAGRSRSNSATP